MGVMVHFMMVVSTRIDSMQLIKKTGMEAIPVFNLPRTMGPEHYTNQEFQRFYSMVLCFRNEERGKPSTSFMALKPPNTLLTFLMPCFLSMDAAATER